MSRIVLAEIIKRFGFLVAEACGCSPRGYKWIANGSLPRADYTDETNFAEDRSGGQFTAAQIRGSASLKPPNRRPFKLTPEEVSQMESSTTQQSECTPG